MSDIDKILDKYNYAETITRTIPEIGLKVTVASSDPVRNVKVARKLQELMLRTGVEDINELPKEAYIELICDSLLVAWNATRDGKPVPVAEAAGVLRSNIESGYTVARYIDILSSSKEAFLADGPSKKKPSSTSTRKVKSSAKTRQSSKRKPKPAGTRSRRASKTTSAPSAPG